MMAVYLYLIQAELMACTFRNNPNFKGIEVPLVKDIKLEIKLIMLAYVS